MSSESKEVSAEFQDTKWVCFSFYVKKAEIEVANKRKCNTFQPGVLLKELVMLIQVLAGENIWLGTLIDGMISSKRYSIVKDSYNSVYLGPKTSRMSLVFSPHNVVPDPREFKQGSYTISGMGKRKMIEGTLVRANIDMKIVVTEWDSDRVKKATEECGHWFSGPIMD